MPKQEPGVRPARPLPYNLRADGVVSGGTLTITFASRGAAGAVFHVTSASDPRTYTVGSGATLAGSWALSSGHDVRVHGPNGFYRQFAGEGPDITAIPAGPNLRLKVTNNSPTAVKLTLADAYAGTSSAVTVPARAAVPVIVRTAAGSGWYDVSVTSDAGPTYLRRLAGHVETGRASISDPALGNA
jgi:phospholipase C